MGKVRRRRRTRRGGVSSTVSTYCPLIVRNCSCVVQRGERFQGHALLRRGLVCYCVDCVCVLIITQCPSVHFVDFELLFLCYFSPDSNCPGVKQVLYPLLSMNHCIAANLNIPLLHALQRLYCMYRGKILIWASLLQQEMWVMIWIIIIGYFFCRGWYILLMGLIKSDHFFCVEITNFRSLSKPWIHILSQQQKSDQIKILHLYQASQSRRADIGSVWPFFRSNWVRLHWQRVPDPGSALLIGEA
jgi:hypothetical protein